MTELLEVTSDQIHALPINYATAFYKREALIKEREESLGKVIIINNVTTSFNSTNIDAQIKECDKELFILNHIKNNQLVANILDATKEVEACESDSLENYRIIWFFYLLNTLFALMSILVSDRFPLAIPYAILIALSITFMQDNLQVSKLDKVKALKGHKFTIKITKPTIPDDADLKPIKIPYDADLKPIKI